MENKVKCEVCGKLLPIEAYKSWTKKDGSISHSKVCVHCQNKESYYKIKMKRQENKFSQFTTKELQEEIKRRKEQLCR